MIFFEIISVLRPFSRNARCAHSLIYQVFQHELLKYHDLHNNKATNF